jgi:hypothetical protein
MRRAALTLLLLVLGCEAADAGKPLAEVRSFQVIATLTPDPHSGAFAPLPARQEVDFVVRIDPVRKTLLLATTSQAAEVAVHTGDGVTFQTDEPIALAWTFESLRVTVTEAGGLQGDGAFQVRRVFGDIISSYSGTVNLVGEPDHTGPNFLGRELDPLQTMAMTSNEPLPAGTRGELVAGGERVSLEPIELAGSGLVLGFRKSPWNLRFGTDYDLEVSPFVDLAGNEGGALAHFTTLPPPPLIAQDGFESATGTLGAALIVGDGELPTLTGQRSVLVIPPQNGQPLDHLLVRLQVAPGAKVVRASLRLVQRFKGQAEVSHVTVAVFVPGRSPVGAAIPPDAMVVETLLATTLPGLAMLWVGDPFTVELPLAPGSREAVFLAGGDGGSVDLMKQTEPGLLIDDVRAE